MINSTYNNYNTNGTSNTYFAYIVRRTFAARTIKKWNAIDTSIRALESVNSFKCNLKKTFLTQQKAAMHLFL